MNIKTTSSGTTALVTILPVKILKGALRVYKLTFSALFGPTCRFHPSCSDYAVLAIERHGVLKGSWLALKRVSRCHPGNPGGVDNVPE